MPSSPSRSRSWARSSRVSRFPACWSCSARSAPTCTKDVTSPCVTVRVNCPVSTPAREASVIFDRNWRAASGEVAMGGPSSGSSAFPRPGSRQALNRSSVARTMAAGRSFQSVGWGAVWFNSLSSARKRSDCDVCCLNSIPQARRWLQDKSRMQQVIRRGLCGSAYRLVRRGDLRYNIRQRRQDAAGGWGGSVRQEPGWVGSASA